VVVLDEMIDNQQMELHTLREGLAITHKTPKSIRTQWRQSIVTSESYVFNISDNVKRSVEQKISIGEWPGPAPIGYLNIDNPETRKKDIILDPERAFLIRRIFEEYATGNYSMEQIARMTKEGGCAAD
jgi:site-specific DNA recombinase